MIEIKREDGVGEWRVHVHDVADDQRRAFMPAQHAGRECPRDLQLADIAGVDLVERGIALVIVGDSSA